MNSTIDWKLWALTIAFGLGALGFIADLTVCHWLPSKEAGVCHAVASDLSAFGRGVAGAAPLLPGDAQDAGALDTPFLYSGPGMTGLTVSSADGGQ